MNTIWWPVLPDLHETRLFTASLSFKFSLIELLCRWQRAEQNPAGIVCQRFPPLLEHCSNNICCILQRLSCCNFEKLQRNVHSILPVDNKLGTKTKGLNTMLRKISFKLIFKNCMIFNIKSGKINSNSFKKDLSKS